MDLNTAMIMGTVASSAFGLGIYIKGIGNDLKDALNTHKLEDAEKFNDHSTRLSLLELKKFGFTHSGKHPDRMDPKTPI